MGIAHCTPRTPCKEPTDRLKMCTNEQLMVLNALHKSKADEKRGEVCLQFGPYMN